MPTTKTLFVITPRSEMERWDITRSKININSALLDGLTASMVRACPQMFTMDFIEKGNGHPIGVAIGPRGYVVVRMPIHTINLTASYQVEGPEMFPAFDGNYPVSTQQWHVPENMHLYLTAHVTNAVECIEQHLVAIDSDRKTWRLPISNLYADCKLCPGRYDSYDSDMLKLLGKVWMQFNASSWNADLYGDSSGLRRSGTRALFTFDVSNAGITQRTPPKNWQACCEKVATDFITNYINY